MIPARGSLQWNVCASWLVHGAGLAIGFFLMPYVLHTVGDAQYGAWVFINSIAGYAGLLYFGFGETISRYVAKHHAREEWARLNEVASLILTIYLGTGALALSAAALLAWLAPALYPWQQSQLFEIRLVILLLGLQVAVSLAGSVFGGILLGMRRFDLERSVALAGDLLRLALVLVFLQRQWGLVTIAAIYLSITVFENACFLIIAFRIMPELSLSPGHLKRSVLRECFQFSGFAFLNAIAQQLIYATDTVVIGFLLGAEAIVPYYIAQRLCQYLRKPIEQIGGVCLPTAGALHAQSQEGPLQRLVEKGMGIAFLLAGGLFIGIIYFGDLVIQNWMGAEYLESQRLLIILFGMQIVALPAGVMRSILFGMGHVRTPALVYVAEAVSNLVMSVVLCRMLGIVGVALGTAIPILLFELGILLPYGLHHLRIRPWRLFCNVLLPQLLPLGGLLVYAASVESLIGIRGGWWNLIEITLGGGLVLGAGWLAFGFLQRRFAWNRSVAVG